MIIDIHAHVAYAPIFPNAYVTGMVPEMEGKGKSILPLVRAFLKDKDCSLMVKKMDEAKIAKTVLLIIDGGICLGEPGLSLEEIFLLHAEILQQYPERFIVFGGVDPRRGREGVDLFIKGFYNFGFRGLKLYPPMGFSLNDEGLIPLLEFCNEKELPVLIHTGPSLKTLDNHLADPLSARNIISKFPKINFILAHAGFCLTSEVVNLLNEFPNVYADIAGIQTLFFTKEQLFEEILIKIFVHNHEKILFGSDWPLFNLMTPLSKQIDMIKAAAGSLAGAEQNAIDNVFFNNALKVLHPVLKKTDHSVGSEVNAGYFPK